jgi:coenzyme PQQ precursor peptide PqqA
MVAFAHRAGINSNILLLYGGGCVSSGRQLPKEKAMKWSTPKVTEVCIGMEINDYFPAEL